MDNSQRLISALKRTLRARAISYAQVAAALELSEATIKRQFSRGHFTLERFQAICDLAKTSIPALVNSQEWLSDAAVHLDIEQERLLIRDRRLLLFAICALSNFTVEAIIERYLVTKAEAVQLLLKLDEMEFLELLPENRIRLRVAPAFEWLPNGPVRQFLCSRLQREYFKSQFDRPNESLLVVNGDFPVEIQGMLIAKLKQVIAECSSINRNQRSALSNSYSPRTLVIAVRPWELEEFQDLRRPVGRQ